VSDWKEQRLTEVGILKRGRSRHRPRYAFHLYGGKYPFIQTGEIKAANKFINTYGQTYSDAGLAQSKLWSKGTLCITIAANIAEIAILNFDACFPDSVLGFIPNKAKCDLDFVYYTLKYFKKELQVFGDGSVQDNINLGTFEHIKFPLPRLPEQRAIAGVLSSLDDKIDLLHRQNRTLEGMAEALWRKMFVEEADPGWMKGKLGDEMDIIMGQSPPGNSYNENKLGSLFFQGRAEFGYRFPDARLYCTAPKRYAKKCDTLVSVRAPVGDINMAFEDCCVGRGLAAVRHNKGFISYTFYKIRSLKDEFDSFEQQGTVFGSIGKDEFNGIDTFIAPEGVIQKFENNAKPIDDKIFANSIQIRTLSRLRDTLLPKLMSGEVKIKQ